LSKDTPSVKFSCRSA